MGIESNSSYLADIKDDLSFNKKLHIENFKDKNIFLLHAYSAYEGQKMLVENEDKTLLLLMGGMNFGYEHKINDLIRSQHIFKYSNSPAEVILHSFEQSGIDVFKNLNGKFALAIWNKNNKHLVLANDLFGLYPLFIYNSEDALIFCSQYQPILKYKNFRKELNHDAIAEYFIFGATLANKTFFKRISILPPASIIELKSNNLKLRQYDRLDIGIDRDKPIKYFTEQANEKLRSAIRACIKEYEINNCELSGGLDTRFILGNILPHNLKNMQFKTRLISYMKGDSDKDVICAKKLAEELNLHHEISRSSKLIDFSENYFEKLRDKYLFDAYVLSGLCGGELLGGGYLYIYNNFIISYDRKKYLNRLNGFFSSSFITRTADKRDYLTAPKFEKRKNILKNIPLQLSINLLNRSFFSAVYDNGVFSGWIQPFQNYLGCRIYPFLDTEFLKFLFTVPPEYLQFSNLYLEVMKKYYRGLLKLPFASGTCRDGRLKQLKCGQYPKNQLYQKIKRFKSYELLRTYMEQPSSWGKENYNKNYYSKIKAVFKFNKYLNYDIAFNADIIRFINFEAWMREYCADSFEK